MIGQFVLNGIYAGAFYALVAFSFVIIYLPARFFHFAHGAVLAWGAYFCFWANVQLSLPLWLAALIGIVLAAGLGVMLEIAIYRPLRQRGATSLVFMLASLGLYVILQNAISLLFGDDIKSLKGGMRLDSMSALGARITPVQAWTIVTALLCCFLLTAFLRLTTFGKALRAVSSDPELALVRGIQTDRVIAWSFAIGSALAALAAILLALDANLVPTMGLNALMMGVVAMIVGGLRSLWGILIGALLLGLAQNLGVRDIGSQWQDAIAFLVLLVVLLVRPAGIAGEAPRKASV